MSRKKRKREGRDGAVNWDDPWEAYVATRDVESDGVDPDDMVDEKWDASAEAPVWPLVDREDPPAY